MESDILNHDSKLYKNLTTVLDNKLLPKKPTQIEERMLKEYAGILTYQVKTRKRSKLLDNTIAYNSKNEMNIKQRIDENIPDSILMQSIGIDIELQSKIYDSNLVLNSLMMSLLKTV